EIHPLDLRDGGDSADGSYTRVSQRTHPGEIRKHEGVELMHAPTEQWRSTPHKISLTIWVPGGKKLYTSE
ncbi:hypothetical protein KA005_10960, partial [bacterium]|nr:hypothetical protein [bacterium]